MYVRGVGGGRETCRKVGGWVGGWDVPVVGYAFVLHGEKLREDAPQAPDVHCLGVVLEEDELRGTIPSRRRWVGGWVGG